MAQSLVPLPDGVAAGDLESGVAQLDVDASLYPLEALYGAAYIFIDRAYVLLDRVGDSRFAVTLTPKEGPWDAAALGRLVGEFGNELLSCAWRHQITQDNRAAIEQVVQRAVSGAMGPVARGDLGPPHSAKPSEPPSLDDLANFDFSSEALEDPLGIATSWEEKYRKKDGGSK